VVIELLDPATPLVESTESGSRAVVGQPEGTPMGTVYAGHGHMTLLPADAATG